MNGVWILILTIVTNGGVYVTHIDGFKSVSDCRAAGVEWFNTTFPKYDRTRYNTVHPNYVCVAQ